MKRLAILGLALLVAGTAWQNAAAQQRGRGFGRGGGSLGLLSQESVQKELQITDDQKQKVADYATKQRESAGDFQNLSREERQEAYAKIQKANEEELGKILDAKQSARLKQIALQQRGVQALSDPQVADALTLTDDQKTKVGTIQQELREHMGEVFQAGGGGDREAARKKMETAQAGANEKLQAILTAEQQTKWKELNGEPFKGEIVRRGGGGGGGGRGPGQRNRGAEVSRPQNPFQLASFKANDDDDDDDKKSAGKKDGDDDDDDKKSAGKKDGDDDKPRAKHDKKKGGKHTKKAHKHKHSQAGKKGSHHSMHARHGGQHHRGLGQPSFGRRPMGGPNAAVWNHVAERVGGRGPGFGHHPPMGGGFAMHRQHHGEHGPMAHHGHRGHGGAFAQHRGPHGHGHGQFAAGHRGHGPAFGHHGRGPGDHRGHGPSFARHHEHQGPPRPAFAGHGHHRGPGPGSFAAHHGPHGPHHGHRHHLSSWRKHHEGDGGPRHFDGPRDEHPRRPPAPPREPRERREERSEVSQPIEQLTHSGDGARDAAVSLARLQQLEHSLDALAQQIEVLRRSISR